MNEAELKQLAVELNAQRTRYQAKFETEKLFAERVKAYVAARAGYFKKLGDEKLEAIQFQKIFDTAKEDLARRLLIIYGHANENGITSDFKQKSRAAGDAYASVSTTANTISAVPGIARAAFLFCTQIAKITNPEAAATLAGVELAVNCVYALAQLGTLGYLPLWQGAKQDICVSKQVAQGPQYIPDVSSDQMVTDQGIKVGLRKKKKILEDLKAYKHKGDEILEIPNDDEADADSEDANDKEDDEEAEQRSRLELLWELNRTALYTQLVVNQGQSRNRINRALWNIGATFSSLAPIVASFFDDAPELISPISTLVSFYPLVGQPYAYSSLHGQVAGDDYVQKIVTFFEIAAMTGLGDFIDPSTRAMDPKRLGKMVKCPMMLRLDYADKILAFDAEVYFCAAVGRYLEGLRLSNPESKAEFLSARALYRKANKDHRAALFRAAFGKPEHEPVPLLEQYNKCMDASALLRAGKLREVLQDEAMLGPLFHEVLCGSLKVAAGLEDCTAEDFAHDSTLIQKKGDSQRLTDLNSSAQTAQKIGQTMTYVILGSGGFYIIRMIFSLTRSVLRLTDPQDPSIPWLGVAQIALQLVSSYYTIGFAHSQQKNTSLKNVFRGRDKVKVPVPNHGVLDESYWPNILPRIKSFKTLLSPEIAAEDRPNPIWYDKQTSTAADSWQQMRAASLSKALVMRFLRKVKGGSSPPVADPNADAVEQEGLDALEQVMREFQNSKIKVKIEELAALREQMLEDRAAVASASKLDAMAEQLGLRGRRMPAFSEIPWRPTKEEKAFKKASAEVYEYFLDFDKEAQRQVCTDFVEYVQCNAARFELAHISTCLEAAAEKKTLKKSFWKAELTKLLQKYGQLEEQVKKTRNAERPLLDLYISRLVVFGLEPPVADLTRDYVKKEKLVAESVGPDDKAIMAVHKYIEIHRKAHTDSVIGKLKNLPTDKKKFLEAVAKNFAHPEGTTFEEYAEAVAAFKRAPKSSKPAHATKHS